VIGKNAECGLPVCCHELSGDPEPGNLNPLKAAGPYGSAKCQLPYTAMDEIFKQAAREHPVSRIKNDR